ncbi:hypothetical protein C2S51_025636 [Perilla frutescens var. frutescens]|nr:hypothetical protein C2S51_025636 [Perilla frutescens var. frutescens]
MYGCFNAWTKGWTVPYNGKGFYAIDKAPGEMTPEFTSNRTDSKPKLKRPRGKATIRRNIFVTPPTKQANNIYLNHSGPRAENLINDDPTSVRIEQALSRDHVRQMGSIGGRYHTRCSVPYSKITNGDRNNNLDMLADIATGREIKGNSKVKSKLTTPIEHVNDRSVEKDIMLDFFKTPERLTSLTMPDMHVPTIFDRVIDIQLVTRLIWEKVTSLEKDSKSRAFKYEDEDDVEIISKPDTVTTKKRKTSVGQPLLIFGHHLDADWSEREMFDALKPSKYYKVKEFDDWYESRYLHGSSSYVPLPIRMIGEASRDWFKPIWSSTGWLTSEHCDALINLLIIKSKRSPCWFETGWTCIESLGWQAMTASNIQLVKDRILPYVNGSYPELGGLPWHLADNIYGIGHVGSDHWVMYEISITSQTINVYDSLSRTIQWETIEDSFKNVKTNLAWLCEEGGVWEKLKVDVHKRQVWNLVSIPHLPQQSNGSDCGIMAMKFLECKVSGRHLGLLELDMCGEYRMSYCAELYHLGVHCASGVDTTLE